MTKLLNHGNTTIDIFKVDCEGCEWELFNQDFFDSLKARNLKIRQIVIEIHGRTTRLAYEHELTDANNWFKVFRNNGK
jgi:hypothetical protein